MDEAKNLETVCHLNFTEPATQQRLTTIIATISKASQNPETLRQMILSGMRIARLNLSHDTQKFHEKTIVMLREISAKCSHEMGYTIQIAIALDTKGPEIRTGILNAGPDAEIELKPDDTFRLSINRDFMDKGDRNFTYVDYEKIIDILLPGSVVYINDGALELRVKELGVDSVTCVVVRGGKLGSRQKVNMPGAHIDLPFVSEKDRNDLKFTLRNNIDMIFASSVRNAADIDEIRSILGEKGKDIKILAKCDSLMGLQNIEEILSAADGLLLDRGDIALYIPPAKIFLIQKAISSLCNRLGKPIIIATKLLASMRYKTSPRRSEIADLGNAVLDGADCVMLSSETASGKYPEACVQMMDAIVREFELALPYLNGRTEAIFKNPAVIDAVHSLALSAVGTAKNSLASAIIVLTTSGRSAYILARYRPRCPILAVTRCSRTYRQCYLHRGVIPMLYTEKSDDNWMNNVDARIQYAMNIAKHMKIISSGDTVLIMSPWKDAAGFANNLRVVYAFFEKDDIDCMINIEAKSTKK
ncbi:pyruvate kinase-like [Haematobia irritans]|uniref:pyruvate kinase-like n=1 Tax=Haematobia irritans TaxID=7368 RepID=UPI003F50A27F